MDKPKYKYNYKTKEWDELHKINDNVHIVGPIRSNGTQRRTIISRQLARDMGIVP